MSFITPIILTVCSFLVIYFYVLWKENCEEWEDFLKIPGPAAYPIIGNMAEVLTNSSINLNVIRVF